MRQTRSMPTGVSPGQTGVAVSMAGVMSQSVFMSPSVVLLVYCRNDRRPVMKCACEKISFFGLSWNII